MTAFKRAARYNFALPVQAELRAFDPLRATHEMRQVSWSYPFGPGRDALWRASCWCGWTTRLVTSRREVAVADHGWHRRGEAEQAERERSLDAHIAAGTGL